MAIDRDILASDHAAIISDLTESATWSSVAYACNRVSMRSQELQARDRDFVQNYTFSLSFAADDFTTLPDDGDLVTYESTIYRVLGTDLSPDGEDLRVHLSGRYGNG